MNRPDVWSVLPTAAVCAVVRYPIHAGVEASRSEDDGDMDVDNGQDHIDPGMADQGEHTQTRRRWWRRRQRSRHEPRHARRQSEGLSDDDDDNMRGRLSSDDNRKSTPGAPESPASPSSQRLITYDDDRGPQTPSVEPTGKVRCPNIIDTSSHRGLRSSGSSTERMAIWVDFVCGIDPSAATGTSLNERTSKEKTGTSEDDEDDEDVGHAVERFKRQEGPPAHVCK